MMRKTVVRHRPKHPNKAFQRRKSAYIWSDEIEEQQMKRQMLNNAIDSLSGGRVSPIRSTLNTSWDDISSTQQKCYRRKAKETICAALTFLSPRQEEELWSAVRWEK